MGRFRLPPALALFLLAPVTAELLSGSAPSVEFFNPFGLVILLPLYGGGALIVRELKVRWKKGIVSILLLGAAYGIMEEGLMVASFFNPGWQDLGQLGVYGRWLNVNWIWAIMLTIYHAVYSITIPILMVELAYPERRHESWVSNGMFKKVIILLASVVIIGFFIFYAVSSYWPPIPQYLLSAFAVITFGYAAYKLPAEWGTNGTRHLPRLLLLWLLGVVGTFVFFFGFWLLPELVPVWTMGMLFGPVLIIIYAFLLKIFDWGKSSDRHIFALISGALTFFIVFAPIQELDATRTDNTFGMTFVGLGFLILLLFMRRRIWAYSK